MTGQSKGFHDDMSSSSSQDMKTKITGTTAVMSKANTVAALCLIPWTGRGQECRLPLLCQLFFNYISESAGVSFPPLLLYVGNSSSYSP